MKVSILIPCHNEEVSIRKCIESCLQQSRKADEIIIVNDGSTDTSLEILETFKDQIIIVNLLEKTGNKSFAQEKGLAYVTGDIVITTDADGILDTYFIENILEEFENPKVVASAGYVKSIKQNWLTACRQIDYLMSQEIHKNAQGLINALYVMPGCAAAYRTNIFKQYISFDHDTVTEDLDFTYQYHENKLKLTFCKKAIVYTQDPSTLRDYITQLRRWHAGNWQNLIKHKTVLNKPANALELSLIYLEGLIFPLLLIVALVLNIKVFLFFSITYLTIILLFALYGAKRDKRWDLIIHVPAYFFASFINYAIFIEQLIREVAFSKKNLTWSQSQRKVITA
ncbi:MAG TPA: glycosyltransferase family 2 protein [Candidatus Saccharimonadales bacterium]|nr:glycosyltransferase family 2 protein [Candidatus Saccharimonadales bacterium]